MELLTVVNRSAKDLNATWDGKPILIKANAKVALPRIVAEAAKRQNVIMGSEDPYTGEMQYLLGIVEFNDDISPIEQTQTITRMNRKVLGTDEAVVKALGGVYTQRDRAMEPGLPSTNGPARTDFSSR